jgi:hypothetical protein
MESTPREELPGSVEKRLLAGSDVVVSVLDDGRIVLDAPGREELILPAGAAFDLLALLYDHKELLYRSASAR